MVKVDLITGFLGSGKTTFIRKYASWLLEKGMNIGILENDYGAVNVDMMLLHDMQGDNCELEMVAGGCHYDCHKRRFKSKLISMGMCGYDRVLIEPSGIFDIDEFFDVLHEEPLSNWYEIGNVITIVDAKIAKELSKESEYLLASQTAIAGKIIFSHTEGLSDTEIQNTIVRINQAMDHLHCNRRIQSEVIAKAWDQLTQADMEDIFRCGYVMEDFVKQQLNYENDYSSVYYMNICMPETTLISQVEKMMGDQSCGKIIRIKGFLKTEEAWLELNATHHDIQIHQVKAGQEVIIVIGEKLKEEQINKYWQLFTNSKKT